MREKGHNKLLAIAFLCVGAAFAVLAVSSSSNRFVFLMVAIANFGAGVVFLSQHRAATRRADSPERGQD